uniref:Leucine rich repeat protein 1 n=1 Tax=Petromyzon marinus TaxID=7757 RepID=S4RJ70_PETMA
MRLQCDVETSSRLLPSCGLRGRGRGIWSALTIGARGGGAGSAAAGGAGGGGGDGGDKDGRNAHGQLWLMVCSSKDKAGSRYKLKGNIEQLFTKFVDEGKATVRLKEPPVDLCLSKASTVGLKGFLSALRLAHQDHNVSSMHISSLAPARSSDVEKPRERMTVLARADYPLIAGFPSSLQTLQVSNCRLSRVDSRMLNLRHLCRLDLSHNHVRELTAALSSLGCLAELVLADNHLEAFPSALCSDDSALRRSLRLLDLSRNRLRSLPHNFGRLSELAHLRLDDNRLTALWRGLGRPNAGVGRLRSLSAARNAVARLPGGFARLRLDVLDLHGNPLEQPRPRDLVAVRLLLPPTLAELAARAAKACRLPYCPASVPAELCRWLDAAEPCEGCGSFALDSFVAASLPLDLRCIATQVVLLDHGGRGQEAPRLVFFCSRACHQRFILK